MLTPDGQPREDLWVEDRIHPNHEGYLIRVKLMRPLLGTAGSTHPVTTVGVVGVADSLARAIPWARV